MNPRQDCEVILEEHAEDRIVDRGLPYVDLQGMVRKGNWRRKRDSKYDIRHGKWTIMVKLGHCIIAVETVIRRGSRK